MPPSVTLLTMVSKRPERVVAQVQQLRDLVDEIVVTAHRSDWLELFAAVADERLLIDPAPKSRHYGWLLSRCRTDWILVADDDEVISPGLVAEIPSLVADRHITHACLPRRWLHPTASSYITTRPWSIDLQTQLLRNLPALWRFPGRVHEPIIVGGRGTIATEPLYHLALLDKSYEQRAAKYADYESSNPGRWTEGIPVNLHGMPELVPGLRTAATPRGDLEAIERFEAGAQSHGAARSTVEARLLADADHQSESRAIPTEFHEHVEIGLVDPPDRMRAAQRVELQVEITNRTSTTLTDEISGSPILVAYHWLGADGRPLEWDGIRTPLWSVVTPGSRRRQSFSVMTPVQSGTFLLQPALVHEGRSWFSPAAPPHVVEVVAGDASLEIDAGTLGRLHIWTDHLPLDQDRQETPR